MPQTDKMMPLQGVLFDLDGTLYDYDLCHQKALEYAAQVAERELGLESREFNELYKKSRHVVHQRLSGTASSHSRLLYFNELVFSCTKKPFIPVVILLEKAYWTTFFKNMRIYPGVFSLLKKLRSSAVKLALVTDMTAAIQFEKIKLLKLANMFDVVITSEEAGHEKPDPIIFEICLKKLDVDAVSAIHIGDDYQRDIAGAEAAGIKSMLFISENKAAMRNNINIIRSFPELEGILMAMLQRD